MLDMLKCEITFHIISPNNNTFKQYNSMSVEILAFGVEVSVGFRCYQFHPHIGLYPAPTWLKILKKLKLPGSRNARNMILCPIICNWFNK